MQLENSEELLRLLFFKILDRNRLTDVNVRGTVQALRSAFTTAELHRLLYVLSTLPKEGRKPVEEEVLRDYRTEVVMRLQEEHLFLARGKEFQPIRRPGLLLTYSYLGQTYLAISERRLVSAEKGKLKLFELADFQYLPKPARAAPALQICKQWGVELPDVDRFLRTFFYEAAHEEQVDVFYDNQFNLLRYDKAGKFLEALPGPQSMIPTLTVIKSAPEPGELGPEPEENEEADKEPGEGELSTCGSELCSSPSSSSLP